MPLNSILPEKSAYVLPGHLYVVATPLGNKDDITLRALEVLKHADLVAAEDTRHTAGLFSLHGIQNRMISYHEHNEARRTASIIDRLKSGDAVALVSNAGTPTISDPGYDLIKAAVANDIPVVPIPGVSAPVTALSVSGLPTDAFIFIGFLSRKNRKRNRQLEEIKKEKRTIILYESPTRIVALVHELIEKIGDRTAMLAREMTKFHEEFIRGRLSEIAVRLEERAEVKGECTLVLSGGEDEPVPMDEIRQEIAEILAVTQVSASDLSKILARQYGISKNIIYDQIIEVQG